jgi:hypothetical protein
VKGDKPPTKQAAIYAAQHQFLSRNRPHTEGVNAFFSRLYYSAKTRPDLRVRWLEKDLWMLGIDPDGRGEITWHDGQVLPFWLEHDRGTETLGYLARKVKTYKEHTRRYSDARKSVLLIELSSERRLRNFLPVTTDVWKADLLEWDNPTLVVAVRASNQNERTFTHPEEFPNAFNDRRWHILGWRGTHSPTELLAVAEEIRSPNRPT